MSVMRIIFINSRLVLVAGYLCFSVFTFAQVQKPSSCDNLDFSHGDFTNWTGHTSIYPAGVPGCGIDNPTPPYASRGTGVFAYYYNTGIVNGRQTIMSAPIMDPFTCDNVSELPPNEPYCARLGNGGFGFWGDGVEYQRDYLSYTISVTAATSLLTYKYAVVLQDPTHDPASGGPHPPPLRPRFITSIFNSSGSLIDPTCGYLYVYVDTLVNGFRNCPYAQWRAEGDSAHADVETVYRAWTTVGVDLRSYIGQDVTLQFETWDCGVGGHFGYAYVSARCDSFSVQTQTCSTNGSVGLTAPDGFSYKWFPSGETTRSITVFHPNPGDSVYVNLTTENGCQTSVGTKIYPTIAKANYKVNPLVVCLKDSFAFKDSSFSYYTGNNSQIPILNWNWNFGDGMVSSIPNPNHTYSIAGTYTVNLTIVNANGCTDSIQKVVQVLPTPVADFLTSDVCAKTSASFVDLSQISGSQVIKDWTWVFKDNNDTSLLQNTSHAYYTPGTYRVNLFVTTDHGCTDSISKTIKIWPSPRADFSTTEVCIGDTTFFSDQSLKSDNADNIMSWIWDFGDNSSFSSDRNPSHLYLKDSTYQVELIVTTAKGCIDDTTINALVHPRPTASFTANPLCKSSPVTFQDLSTPAGAIASWNWNFGDIQNTTSNVQNPTHSYDSSMVYYPKLVVASAYGCKDSFRMPVDIPPLPIVSFNADRYDGCSPLCVNFIDLSFSGSDSITTWNWTFGDGDSSALKGPPHCYPNPGAYSVSLSVGTSKSCKQNLSWSDMIHVYPHPKADFIANPSETSETTPFIKFTDKSDSADYWRWSFGDNTQGALAKDTSHTYSQSGTYKVWLYVSNQYGCIDSIAQEIVITPEWSFYVPDAFTPNDDGKNDGFIAVGVNLQDFEMRVFDRWGSLIYYCSDITKPWNGMVNNGADGDGSKIAQQDVYVWKITFKDVFNAPHSYIGHVTLLR